ncbi:MAG TPA: D-Ala-D-Ala carboxypeptidase family metallohydrolase [Thermoleophilaceae bacterium]|nr:D-Ala-D-Ala carboxypeptidase family metallohydrolase [Thermoleophilaceae bacterium]
MNTREVQEALRRIGWPIDVDGAWGGQTYQAVWDFQRGFAFSNLLIDGHAGPKTHEALRLALEEEGRCSPHFAFREFKSKGNGWIKVNRELVRGLEEYREDLARGPVVVVSGYRDPRRNAQVGGAKNSQHLYGNAADLEPLHSVAEVRRLRRFSGIGYNRASGKVPHVDVRHTGPNTTNSSIANPMTWPYPR